MVRRIIRRNLKTGRIVRTDSNAVPESVNTVIGVEGVSTDAEANDNGFAASEPDSAIGDVDNGTQFVDPATSRSDPDGNDPARSYTGRGRPRGSKNKSAVQGSLTSLLFSLHTMGAVLLKTPELEISEQEAKKLNDGITDVARYYTDAELPPKVQAWLNLLMVAGTVYGPRVIAIKIRSKNNRPKIIPGTTVSQGATSNRDNGSPKVTPISQPAQTVKPPVAQNSDFLKQWSSWNANQATIDPQY
jgi:hypothetical protein